MSVTSVTSHNGESPVEVRPSTPSAGNTGKQQHGNVQVALCSGGSLQSTPGAVLP